MPGEEILTKRPGQINDLKVVDVFRIGSTPIYPLSVAITAGVTTTSKAAGSLAVTSNETGRGILFYSDGTYWQATAQPSGQKDATGGYAGLTLFKINFKNALNTFTSFFTNANTAARTYTFPDKTMTVAGTSDIPTGNSASYVRTTTGTQTLLVANALARQVIIIVKVVTTFAAGDGAAPIFDIGETGTVEKFKADLTTGTAGDVLIYAGTLTAAAALLITATAATGATSTGAIDVTVLALPDE